MDYIRITIFTSQPGIEVLSGALDTVGVSQLEVIDDADELTRMLKESARYWDFADASEIHALNGRGCVRAYVCEPKKVDDIQAAVDALRHEDFGVNMGSLEVVCDVVREEDWADSWKQYFKPLEIGAFVVCPAWETPPKTDKIILNIDPGMTFGTGQHETTALCLEALSGFVKPGDRVLDAGCGSGILSIGALLLNAASAVGVDIDQNSRTVVARNAALNDLAVEAIHGDILLDRAIQARIGVGYDIVIANIIADVVIALIPLLKTLLKPGGIFIASGIIDERGPDVIAQLNAHGLTLRKEYMRKNWLALVSDNA